MSIKDDVKFEAVIFDWDGTLAKTLHLWLIGYREGLQEQQHTFPDSIIARDFFYEHDKAELKYPSVDFDALVSYARSYIQRHVELLELYAGVKHTLDSLSNKKLALVSSSPRSLLEAGLEVNGLTDIAGDDVSKHKPHPESFLQTLDCLCVKADRVLIIGDAKTDILAGQEAGVKTCFFSPEDNKIFYDFDATRSIGPDYEVNNLSEILEIVL
ncbi:MAG: Pyrophosphatase PpaX [Parcubacteria bacterium OLB19]|nr:MAG: Pyrophosphatase PpaX [Parcubacteria bacterium OLB19]